MIPFLLLFNALTASQENAALHERRQLLEKAQAIVQATQDLEITTAEARRRVELLLKELRSWADTHGVGLVARSRTYAAPARGRTEPLTANRCPLFFEDDIEEHDEICPLDLSRSEVWGGSVVFCRYVCAPSPR
ncbi:MAG TPA: hypothetical protein VEK15_23035 [Vicinamibacteria bacterium]|nr:hypothetical protein [Vicinamibacteria bacterium]